MMNDKGFQRSYNPERECHRVFNIEEPRGVDDYEDPLVVYDEVVSLIFAFLAGAIFWPKSEGNFLEKLFFSSKFLRFDDLRYNLGVTSKLSDEEIESLIRNTEKEDLLARLKLWSMFKLPDRKMSRALLIKSLTARNMSPMPASKTKKDFFYLGDPTLLDHFCSGRIRTEKNYIDLDMQLKYELSRNRPTTLYKIYRQLLHESLNIEFEKIFSCDLRETSFCDRFPGKSSSTKTPDFIIEKDGEFLVGDFTCAIDCDIATERKSQKYRAVLEELEKNGVKIKTLYIACTLEQGRRLLIAETNGKLKSMRASLNALMMGLDSKKDYQLISAPRHISDEYSKGVIFFEKLNGLLQRSGLKINLPKENLEAAFFRDERNPLGFFQKLTEESLAEGIQSPLPVLAKATATDLRNFIKKSFEKLVLDAKSRYNNNVIRRQKGILRIPINNSGDEVFDRSNDFDCYVGNVAILDTLLDLGPFKKELLRIRTENGLAGLRGLRNFNPGTRLNQFNCCPKDLLTPMLKSICEKSHSRHFSSFRNTSKYEEIDLGFFSEDAYNDIVTNLEELTPEFRFDKIDYLTKALLESVGKENRVDMSDMEKFETALSSLGFDEYFERVRSIARQLLCAESFKMMRDDEILIDFIDKKTVMLVIKKYPDDGFNSPEFMLMSTEGFKFKTEMDILDRDEEGEIIEKENLPSRTKKSISHTGWKKIPNSILLQMLDLKNIICPFLFHLMRPALAKYDPNSIKRESPVFKTLGWFVRRDTKAWLKKFVEKRNVEGKTIGDELLDNLQTKHASAVFIQDLSYNLVFLISLSTSSDFALAELLRALKYTSQCSLAYAADIKGLISKKIVKSNRFSHPLSTLIAWEMCENIEKVTKRRDAVFTKERIVGNYLESKDYKFLQKMRYPTYLLRGLGDVDFTCYLDFIGFISQIGKLNGENRSKENKAMENIIDPSLDRQWELDEVSFPAFIATPSEFRFRKSKLLNYAAGKFLIEKIDIVKIKRKVYTIFTEESVMKNMSVNANFVPSNENVDERTSQSVYESMADSYIEGESMTILDIIERDLKNRSRIVLGFSQKGDNRDESREVVIADRLMRLLHEVYNTTTKALAVEFDEEIVSKRGNFEDEAMLRNIDSCIKECNYINNKVLEDYTKLDEEGRMGVAEDFLFPIFLNQDMSKFTSIQDYESYDAFFQPLCETLGPAGIFIRSFNYLCFHKFYEIKNSFLTLALPNVANLRRKGDKADKVWKAFEDVCSTKPKIRAVPLVRKFKDYLVDNERKGLSFESKNQSPQGFLMYTNSIRQVGIHRLRDAILNDLGREGETTNFKSFGFLDNHDDHTAVLATNYRNIKRLTHIIFFIHYLIGGNPNPQKTMLGSWSEIISKHYSEKTIFIPETKLLSVPLPLNLSYFNCKQNLNSFLSDAQSKGVARESLIYKLLTSYRSLIVNYNLTKIHGNDLEKIISLPKSLFGLNDFRLYLGPLQVNQEMVIYATERKGWSAGIKGFWDKCLGLSFRKFNKDYDKELSFYRPEVSESNFKISWLRWRLLKHLNLTHKSLREVVDRNYLYSLHEDLIDENKELKKIKFPLKFFNSSIFKANFTSKIRNIRQQFYERNYGLIMNPAMDEDRIRDLEGKFYDNYKKENKSINKSAVLQVAKKLLVAYPAGVNLKSKPGSVLANAILCTKDSDAMELANAYLTPKDFLKSIENMDEVDPSDYVSNLDFTTLRCINITEKIPKKMRLSWRSFARQCTLRKLNKFPSNIKYTRTPTEIILASALDSQIFEVMSFKYPNLSRDIAETISEVRLPWKKEEMTPNDIGKVLKFLNSLKQKKLNVITSSPTSSMEGFIASFWGADFSPYLSHECHLKEDEDYFSDFNSQVIEELNSIDSFYYLTLPYENYSSETVLNVYSSYYDSVKSDERFDEEIIQSNIVRHYCNNLLGLNFLHDFLLENSVEVKYKPAKKEDRGKIGSYGFLEMKEGENFGTFCFNEFSRSLIGLFQKGFSVTAAVQGFKLAKFFFLGEILSDQDLINEASTQNWAENKRNTPFFHISVEFGLWMDTGLDYPTFNRSRSRWTTYGLPIHFINERLVKDFIPDKLDLSMKKLNIYKCGKRYVSFFHYHPKINFLKRSNQCLAVYVLQSIEGEVLDFRNKSSIILYKKPLEEIFISKKAFESTKIEIDEDELLADLMATEMYLQTITYEEVGDQLSTSTYAGLGGEITKAAAVMNKIFLLANLKKSLGDFDGVIFEAGDYFTGVRWG